MADRFWSKVDRSGGPDACWPWTGARYSNGYGAFRIGGRKATGGYQTTAQRVALALHRGIPVEQILQGCHHCDNPPCCNPSHLFDHTQGGNLADASAKGRLVGNRGVFAGERNRNAKLTEDQVREIRRRAEAGERHASIAADFGIAVSLVSLIKTRAAWRHVA